MGTTRQQQAEATKKHIAHVALRLFSEQGFAATSTRQIAEEAEVSEGLVFHHYPTKRDLLAGVVSSRPGFAREILTTIDSYGDQSIESYLQHIGTHFVTMMHPGAEAAVFFNMILAESRRGNKLHELMQGTFENTISTIARFLAERVEAGELRADLPAESAARAFIGALLVFFVSRKDLSLEDWNEEASTYVKDVTAHWLRGARP